jgi:Transposase DDE domain group 1
MAKAIRLVRPRTVTGDGEGLVSHAGSVWLGEVADRSGLTAGLCQAMAEMPRRRHDPGVTLAQMIVALADGAECVSDLAMLRDQPALFGAGASQPTAWRTIGGSAPASIGVSRELGQLLGLRHGKLVPVPQAPKRSSTSTPPLSALAATRKMPHRPTSGPSGTSRFSR